VSPDRDEVLEYVDWRYSGPPSRVRLRAWNLLDADAPPVVVLTQLDDNAGASVTNTIETATELVYVMLGAYNRTNAALLEHYPGRERDGTFDLVTFNPVRRIDGGFQQPKWRRLRDGELEQLLPPDDARELLAERRGVPTPPIGDD
jgi:hypothetical protein